LDGTNDSTRSSCAVMSTGVPIVEMIENPAQRAPGEGELDVDDRHDRGDRARCCQHGGVGPGAQAVHELRGREVHDPADSFPPGALEQCGSDLVPVAHGGSHGSGLEHQPHDVGGIRNWIRRAQTAEQTSGAIVDANDVPAAVHHDRRKGLVPAQHALQRTHDLFDRRMIDVVSRLGWARPVSTKLT